MLCVTCAFSVAFLELLCLHDRVINTHEFKWAVGEFVITLED